MEKPTLKRAVGLLGQGEVFFTNEVYRLVLVDFHTSTNIAVSMQEEGKGAGQVLTKEEVEGNEDV